jgi:hypothetical protein
MGKAAKSPSRHLRHKAIGLGMTLIEYFWSALLNKLDMAHAVCKSAISMA